MKSGPRRAQVIGYAIHASKRLAIMSLVVELVSGCASVNHNDDLSGMYSVRGECAYRTESGDYESCEAWNTLTLLREQATATYDFSLETNTFATTQGGCYLEGKLERVESLTKSILIPSGAEPDDCHFSLEVTADQFVLHVLKSEKFTSCKLPYCGHNSTLYSAPFPRSSRENVPKPPMPLLKKARKAPKASAPLVNGQ